MITSNSPYLINEFYLAQVINKTSGGNTYKSNTNGLFAIDVQTDNNINPKELTNIQPCNLNIKQIPVTGESVLIFRTINNQAKYKADGSGQWYYMYPINIQSNINNNILPSTTSEPKLDTDFNDTIKTSPLQPYRGDLLLEGRWGNSIRFGSTITSGEYDVETTWSGTKNGDPVLILSNTTKRETGKQFLTESLKDSKSSSIWLSSTQNFTELKLKQSLRKFTKETEYRHGQLIAQANRIVLRSDKDITVIDSNKAIVLNSNRILLGHDTAESPMVHGDVLFEVLTNILDVLDGTWTGTAGVVSVSSLKGTVSVARRKLNKIKSKKYYISKE